ncbi:MAG: 50S ribosomal protein L3 N(5)-glutamine methyltransferase [Burkholderiales bacterium]
MTLIELIEATEQQLTDAQVAFGHGTDNAFDEAAWLVLWRLGLPLDSALDEPEHAPESVAQRLITPLEQTQVAALVQERIASRKPAAFLTREAWLQGVPFYVDERAIVPRSLIAEVLVSGGLDPWLPDAPLQVLDLCTGNASLAVIAALAYPQMEVCASDISDDALAVAHINVERHGLQSRIALLCGDGLRAPALQERAAFDLIVCNPPYVNAQSMAALPPEYRAEPALALAGGSDGMDFIRHLLADAPTHLTSQGVLVLEIGNERAHFEAAFPTLEVVWLETSAGEDQVLLLTRSALSAEDMDRHGLKASR